MRVLNYICALIICIVSFESVASDISSLQQAHQDHRTAYHYHMAKKHDEALKWYKKGASAGLAKSEFAMARLLTIDRDGPRDYTAALPWLIRAAAPRSTSQGYGFEDSQKYAREMLDWICKSGVASFPETMPQSQDSYCLYRRGRKLYYGSKKNSVQRDYVAARNYLHKALTKDEPRAAKYLMWIYGEGLGTPPNPELYQKMMKIAAKAGDGSAIMALTTQDKDQLSQDEYIANLHRAAIDGHKKANRYLGDIYFSGEPYGQDIERAFTHYFLSGRKNFLKRHSIFAKKTWFKNIFEDPQSDKIFKVAKLRAEQIAEENNFSKRQSKAIAKSYQALSSEYQAVQEIGRVRSIEENALYILLILLAIMGLMRPLRILRLISTQWLYRFTRP